MESRNNDRAGSPKLTALELARGHGERWFVRDSDGRPT